MFVRFFRQARAAKRGVRAVNGLQDVEIKLRAAGHADVEPVLLDRIQNLLGVGLEHGLRAGKGRVVERGTVDGAKNRFLLFRQRAGCAGKERGGKKFDVGQVVGLDELAAQAGAAVGDGPAGLIGAVVELTVQGDGPDSHFFTILPDESPTRVAGDALALPVGLRHAVNFRARRDDQPAAEINILRDQADDGRLDGGRVHRGDGLAWNQPSERRIHRAQFFGLGSASRAVGKQTDGRQQFGLARRHYGQRLRRCAAESRRSCCCRRGW